MDVELLEALRCPAPHAESWLVAVPTRREGGRVLDGTLGCPVCGREWPIVAGGVRLGGADAPVPPDRMAPAELAERALRYAALLDLRTPAGCVLLGGSAAAVADALVERAGVAVLAVNAAADVAGAHARLGVGARLPLGVGTMRGAVLDAHTASLLGDVVRAVARGGRVVAPVGAAAEPAAHPTLREIARDDREWVAEVTAAASGLVPLRRGDGAP